ncbi:hypothetical protein [Streptomyces sp. NPDC059909]|uniref:hypothetical protein n=1 Tax=Streptomyces sp. NPDC059909 TaxID=3346998 RepID=UPI00366199B7
MTTSSRWDRTRRTARAAGAWLVLAVAAALLALAVGVGVPEAWWPRTGQAFAANSQQPQGDPCDLVPGPAKEYCVRDAGDASSAARAEPHASAVWVLLPTAALVGIALRRRGAVVQRQG